MLRLSSRNAAGLGLAFMVLPFYFVSAAALKYAFDFGLFFDPLARYFSDPERLRWLNILSPIVFVGGLAIALAVNLLAVLRIQIQREDHTIVGTLTLKPGLWNLTVIALSGMLLLTILAYAFFENFTHI